VKYIIKTPSGKIFDEEWLGSEDTFNKLFNDGRIWFGENGNSSPRKKYYLKERILEGKKPNNFMWDHKEYGSNQDATKELADIFGVKQVFSNPKPIKLMSNIIKMSTSENDIILDLFSGSGTTGHAVLELNKNSDSNRVFIALQNNEKFKKSIKTNLGVINNQFDVTYKRLKKCNEDYGSNSGIRVFDVKNSKRPIKMNYGDVDLDYFYKTSYLKKKQKSTVYDDIIFCIINFNFDLHCEIKCYKKGNGELYIIKNSDKRELVFFDTQNLVESSLDKIIKKSTNYFCCYEHSFENDSLRFNISSILENENIVFFTIE